MFFAVPPVRIWLLGLFLAAGHSWALPLNAADDPKDDGFRSLFNGKDLSGWVPMYGGEWQVEDGVLVGRNGVGWTTAPEKSGSWLRTEREYSNFTWEFEYAINERGNAGVFLRSAIEKNPAFTGHEMQILDDHGREPRVYSTGALYDVVAAKKNLSKPAGEWNHVRITAEGKRIRIWFNGEPIVDYESDRRHKGYLGLQNHDDRAVIKFRKLRVKDLGGSAKRIRVGVIGLDTSHAPAFTKYLNGDNGPTDIQVVAAYPQGSREIESSVSRVPQITAQMRKLGVKIVPTIEELLREVDAVLLESNDGRPHLEQLRPVLAAGKPVFVDKPIAGSLEDAVAIFREAAEAGVPIFSSSSLRYLAGAQAVRRGEIGTVVGSDVYSPAPLEETHPDLYWYGIHGVEILFTVMGPGCESVTRSSTAGTDVVVGTWSDGRIGTFRGIRAGKRGYGGTAFGSEEIRELGEFEGYQPLVEQIAEFFRTGRPPVDPLETLEIYAFMSAADESKKQGGAPVKLDDVLSAAQNR